MAHRKHHPFRVRGSKRLYRRLMGPIMASLIHKARVTGKIVIVPRRRSHRRAL